MVISVYSSVFPKPLIAVTWIIFPHVTRPQNHVEKSHISVSALIAVFSQYSSKRKAGKQNKLKMCGFKTVNSHIPESIRKVNMVFLKNLFYLRVSFPRQCFYF